jgi:hypothetical protein
MKTARELFPQERCWNYSVIIESFGDVLVQVDELDYQGDTWAIIHRDGKYGYLCFGWGSCSGCDALEACDSYEEVDELIQSLYLGIIWYDSLLEIQAYFNSKDWSMDYCGNKSEFQDFLNKVRSL